MCAHRPEKNELKPWRHERWVIPPKAHAEFVCVMEAGLDVYVRPYDPHSPQVCLDETSKPLVADTQEPLPAHPGQIERDDYEYERRGTANLFMLFEPLTGQRYVEVTEQRTATEFARVIRHLVNRYYPTADKIILVMDNLNTHKLASLYQVFPPEEAHRLMQRLEIHHTPKHGSWLNRAEIELSVLATQCLDRRIPDATTLAREVAAWQTRRNTARSSVDWRFTTPEARIKLKRLYPSNQVG